MGLSVLYSIVFVLLVVVQFAKQGNFTKHIENLVISGQYMVSQSQNQLGFDGQALAGKVVVSFGGIEFRLTEENGFTLLLPDGEKKIVLPEYMTISDKTAVFHIEGGSKLNFSVQDNDLNIDASFVDSVGLEIPYRPLKTSRTQSNGTFTASTRVTYGFNYPLLNPVKQVLVLTNDSPLVSYQVIPNVSDTPVEDPVFNPADFVIADARDRDSFNAVMDEWRKQVFSVWGRTAASTTEEEQIIAYENEALNNGTYRQAINSVSPSFLNGNTRTFESSVYFGRLDQALRSLSTNERETLNRLSQEINDKSNDFFKESHPIEYLSIRGLKITVDAAAAWIRSIDPSNLTPDFIPAVLEGYTDWFLYRPNTDNPFALFNERVLSLISAGIRKTEAGDRVFVFNNGAADMEFNIRLGKALTAFAESTDNRDWASAGRSAVLSVLLLTDSATGSVPKELLISDVLAGTPAPSGGTRISAAHLYRLLAIGENYPRAVSLTEGGSWTLTAAAAVSIASGGNYLDISASFPVGETHYMLIRGVRPSFVRLQLYNIDFRTAPDFERYDSSGWTYSVSEQTLLVKMKHRTQIEHIRIFW
jgi:hypothetical protein